MRRIAMLIASATCIAAMPAGAQEHAAPPSRAGEIADKLNDPLTQYAVAGMLSAASKAVLDMRIDPLVDAVAQVTGRPVDKLPEDARVSDLAGTSHKDVRDQIVTYVPRAMAAMGALAGSAQAMTPQIESMTRQLRDALPKR
jgi:hypothetical protein